MRCLLSVFTIFVLFVGSALADSADASYKSILSKVKFVEAYYIPQAMGGDGYEIKPISFLALRSTKDRIKLSNDEVSKLVNLLLSQGGLKCDSRRGPGGISYCLSDLMIFRCRTLRDTIDVEYSTNDVCLKLIMRNGSYLQRYQLAILQSSFTSMRSIFCSVVTKLCNSASGCGSSWCFPITSDLDTAKMLMPEYLKNGLHGNVKILNLSLTSSKTQESRTSQIRMCMQRNLAALRYSYSKRLMVAGDLSGSMSVHVTINNKGNVIECYQDPPSFKDTVFVNSILDKIAKWDFSAAENDTGTTEFMATFIFSPSKE